jgi:hypothetical protein
MRDTGRRGVRYVLTDMQCIGRNAQGSVFGNGGVGGFQLDFRRVVIGTFCRQRFRQYLDLLFRCVGLGHRIPL